MTFCPILKADCPETTNGCTFWEEFTIPGHRSKRCEKCGGEYEDCDYCDGYIDEKKIRHCTLKEGIRKREM